MKTIHLPSGPTVLSASLSLESGTVLEGAPDGSSVLCGGLALKNWHRRGELWVASVPGWASPRMLIINGELRQRSRFPLTGRLQTLDSCELRWMNSVNGGWNRKPTSSELLGMTVDSSALPDFEVRNAEVTMFHVWDESTVRVRSFDRTTGRIEFADEACHPSGAFGRHDFVLWNIEEGMGTPGCWMHDRVRSEIVYHPLPGEEIESAWMSALNGIVTVDGGSDITIRNLTLELGNYSNPNAGLRAVNPEGAIDIRNAERVLIENVTIRNCAGSGIRTQRTQNLEIRNCRIEGMGAGGITTLESMPSVIRDNHVMDTGRLCYSAPGITAGGKSTLVYVQDGCVPETGKALIAGNVIRSCSYCGIVCCGPAHEIVGNDISQVMTVLHDGGAVYVSRGENMLIHDNYIHDMPEGDASGLYLDELSKYCVEEDNVIVNSWRPFHNHKAEACVIYNNTVMRAEGEMVVNLNACQDMDICGNRFIGPGKVVVKGLEETNKFHDNLEFGADS